MPQRPTGASPARRCAALLCPIVLLLRVGVCPAGEPAEAAPSFWQRDTLSDNWFGVGRQLEQQGITVGLGLTQIYQLNLEGALATGRHAGRYTGTYDLEAEFDLDKLLKLPGGRVYVLTEGGWSEGLNASSVGSLLGVNADAVGDQAVQVSELWYQQCLLGRRLRVRIGKLDMTGGFECRGCAVAFDGSAYANDEVTQFLSDALVNNPTIPFPDYGLGAIVYAEPVEGLYLAAGAADAQADGRETGFRTAFHEEDYFLAMFETGVVTNLLAGLPGTYRVGLWYDPQPKQRFSGGTKRDDLGLYLSCDQLVFKERADADDAQGLGLFARFGFADDDVSEINTFWSAGAQYQGLIPGRDGDVLAVGVAQGLLSRDAGFSAPRETVIEVYYSAAITGWLTVSGHVQYVGNPGGSDELDDAVVVGIRAQLSF